MDKLKETQIQKSKSVSLTQLRQKIQSFLELGTEAEVSVDPRTRTMEAYRWIESGYDTQIYNMVGQLSD